MQVVIDKNAGFCSGVMNAIRTAEAELEAQGSLYCLGDIVHNDAEVSRLAGKGLHVIDHKELEGLHDTRVLIRAHGEPPSTYATAQRQHIALVEATCPIVRALQEKIRRGYEEMARKNGQVVIFGKPGHAEVVGLNGQTDNTAIVVSALNGVEALVDCARPIRLYSQTTKNKEDYEALIALLKERCAALGNNDFLAYNTICNRVSNRAQQLASFAESVDLLLFVSGPNSSNGRYLFDYCAKVQPNTRFVTHADEIAAKWFQGAQTVGITGATSTPRWLMEQIASIAQNIVTLPN